MDGELYFEVSYDDWEDEGDEYGSLSDGGECPESAWVVWRVFQPHDEPWRSTDDVSVHRTKRAAVAAARKLAKQEGARVVVKDRGGE